MALLSPKSIIIGMDLSNSVLFASRKYLNIKNLIFIKGDISKKHFKENVFDFIVCDQVLHHTLNPPKTLKNLVKMLKKGKEIATYVYQKKALPRELIDDYFIKTSKKLSKKELLKLSEQLTILGKKLSELKIDIEVPDIELLGIKGGKWNLQRFIYYNFLKCYWNENIGFENSVLINYDWYAPKVAHRYTKEEFLRMLKKAGLEIVYFFIEEMASYSGRFHKRLP